MEKEESPPPSPLLAFIYGEDNEILTLRSISEDEGTLNKEVPLNFRNNNLKATCGEWLIVWDDNDTHYSLWNPLTAEIVALPDPDLPPQSEIRGRILTSPPGNPDCILILYENEEPSLRYCRIGEKIWKKQLIPNNILEDDEDDYIENFVTCNGRIYCRTFLAWNKLVGIDIKPEGLVFSNIKPRVPLYRNRRWELNRSYFVESCGELFIIYLLLNGNGQRRYKSVGLIEIFRLDFELEEWIEVESFEDKAFFLSPESQCSCLVAPQCGIRGNYVYFTFDGDQTLYSFNMEDKTILFSSSCPNLSEFRLTSFWIMSDSRRSDLSGESKQEQKLVISTNCFSHGSGKRMKPDTIEGDLGTLNLHILYEIASRLRLRDYFKFRAVNSWYRSILPPNRWTSSLFKGLKGYDSLPHWLMLWEFGHDICNFIDPLCGDRYTMSIPYSELKNGVLSCSKGGWCVVLQGEHSIFIWNPFSKTMMPLPDLTAQIGVVAGCGFSSLPDSPESDCTIVLLLYYVSVFRIDYTYLGGEIWKSYSFKSNGFRLLNDNYPVFFNGVFYFLDENGKLGIFREKEDILVDADGDTVLDQVLDCPCEFFHQKFLLECDGKVLSIFVGFLGCLVNVFQLDESNTVWVEVESLGNHTLYLSQFSSTSTISTRGMQNRIYFNRYYEKNIVYYSLDSKQLHVHDTGEALVNFYDTKEQLLCSWLSPSF